MSQQIPAQSPSPVSRSEPDSPRQRTWPYLLAAAIILLADPLDAGAIHEFFRGAHKEGDTTVAPGPGAPRKAEFAVALAHRLRDARNDGTPAVLVPEPLRNVFTFLYESMQSPDAPLPPSAPPPTAPPPAPAPPAPAPAPSAGLPAPKGSRGTE